MYFKIVMIKLKTSSKIMIKKINFSDFFENFDFDDNLFDVKDIQ